MFCSDGNHSKGRNFVVIYQLKLNGLVSPAMTLDKTLTQSIVGTGKSGYR